MIKHSFSLIYVAVLCLLMQFEGAFKLHASNDLQQTGTNSENQSDQPWNDILNALQQLEPPREWVTNRPAPEVMAKFRQNQAATAVTIANKAGDFYSRFPNDDRAAEAKSKEKQLLGQAERLGNVKARERLVELDDARLKDPSTSENESFEIRLSRLQQETRRQMSKMTNGMEAALEVYAKGARQLRQEFPKLDEPYEMLLAVAMKASDDKGRVLAREIVESTASEGVKAQARAILKKLEMLGKPFALKFTAMDGREVDFGRMKGKVVLVDFWASWSGPYVSEWPKFKTAYEKWHSAGCEIVGVSFDLEKEPVENFIAKEKVGWPQYFDGQGWKNKIGMENGIKSLPSLWLIDKKGVLRDQNAREQFEQKMEKYMAE